MHRERKISLGELYNLVWEMPMCRLASEMGISDSGLAKICRQNSIPTPARGHWVKIEAGKKVERPPFPHEAVSESKIVLVSSGYKMSSTITSCRIDRKTLEAELDDPVLPVQRSEFHPVVLGWLRRENPSKCKFRTSRDSLDNSWGIPAISEIDLYRLRVTSAFLSAVEAGGTKILSSEHRGRFKLEVEGAELVARIQQKMSTRTISGISLENWTAWPDQQNSGLFPTNDLKLSLEGRYITDVRLVLGQKGIESGGLKKFISCVLAAPTAFNRQVELHRARERDQQEAKKQARVEEATRIREDSRWEKFNELANNWEKLDLLKRFLRELKSKSEMSLDKEIEGKAIRQWLQWAERMIEKHDPTNHIEEVFLIDTEHLKTTEAK